MVKVFILMVLLKITGKIASNKNDIKIGNTGLLDEPEIKNAQVNGENAVAIFNIGKDSIDTFNILEDKYYIKGNDILKTTDNSKADIELKLEKDIDESDRVTNKKYDTEGIYICGFKVEESMSGKIINLN